MLEILTAIFEYIDMPALILVLMLSAAWGMIRSAQKRADFDFGNMLKDENGKESAMRLGVLAAIAFSSWYVMSDLILSKAGDPTILLIYLVCWSGSPVALKLGEALVAKWTK